MIYFFSRIAVAESFDIGRIYRISDEPFEQVCLLHLAPGGGESPPRLPGNRLGEKPGVNALPASYINIQHPKAGDNRRGSV